MTLFQIASKNISRDRHTYFAYYISSAVTILIFFLFTAAACHPDLNQIQDGSTLALTLTAGNVIIYGFAFLFIGYSSWAFLGSRGKQLGIYSILGMSPKQMKQMLFRENMLIGLAALATGLVTGVLTCGLFFKLIHRIFVTVSFNMYLPVLPLVVTLLLFLILFLVIAVLTPVFISRKNVLSFLKSDKSYAQPLEVSMRKLVLALVFLVALLLLLVPKIGNRLGDFWNVGIFFCVICLVFLLVPQICAVYTAVRKRSKKHLRGIRLFADAEISTGCRENGNMMSFNVLLLTASFLAICVLGSLQRNVVPDVEKIMPFPYFYVEREGNERAEQDIALLDRELLADGTVEKVQYEILRKEFSYGFIKAGDFNKILKAKGKEPVSLGDKELLMLSGNGDVPASALAMQEDAKKFLHEWEIDAAPAGFQEQRVSVTGMVSQVYVISDEQWNMLKNQEDCGLAIERYTAYEDPDWQQHLALAGRVEGLLDQNMEQYDFSYSFASLGNYYGTELLMRKLCTFVGCAICILFLSASISIVYFRLYTTLEREKKKYDDMYKLGFSLKEMRRSVNQKISILLWLHIYSALAAIFDRTSVYVGGDYVY